MRTKETFIESAFDYFSSENLLKLCNVHKDISQAISSVNLSECKITKIVVPHQSLKLLAFLEDRLPNESLNSSTENVKRCCV